MSRQTGEIEGQEFGDNDCRWNMVVTKAEMKWVGLIWLGRVSGKNEQVGADLVDNPGTCVVLR